MAFKSRLEFFVFQNSFIFSQQTGMTMHVCLFFKTTKNNSTRVFNIENKKNIEKKYNNEIKSEKKKKAYFLF